MKYAILLAVVPFVLAACDDKKVDDKTAASASASLSASAPVASASAAPSAAPSAVAASPAIPSQADEAIKAAKEIDKANYKTELDKLEKEITAK